jgi:hypothetical protein
MNADETQMNADETQMNADRDQEGIELAVPSDGAESSKCAILPAAFLRSSASQGLLHP